MIPDAARGIPRPPPLPDRRRQAGDGWSRYLDQAWDIGRGVFRDYLDYQGARREQDLAARALEDELAAQREMLQLQYLSSAAQRPPAGAGLDSRTLVLLGGALAVVLLVR